MSADIPPPFPRRPHPLGLDRPFVLSLVKCAVLALPFLAALLFVKLFVDPKYLSTLDRAGFHPTGAATWPGFAGGWLARDFHHVYAGGLFGVAALLCLWLDRRVRSRGGRLVSHATIASFGYLFQLGVLALIIWQLCLFAIAVEFASSPPQRFLYGVGLEIPARQILESYEPRRWFTLDPDAAPLPSLPADERKRQLARHLESLESRAAERYQWSVLMPFDQCRDDLLNDAELAERVYSIATRILGQPVTSLDELSRHCERLAESNEGR